MTAARGAQLPYSPDRGYDLSGDPMIVFPCHVCRTQLSAEDAQAGQLVRCPTCLTTLRVPAAAAQPAMAGAGATSGGSSAGGSSPTGAWSSPAARSPYGTVPGSPRPAVGKR